MKIQRLSSQKIQLNNGLGFGSQMIYNDSKKLRYYRSILLYLGAGNLIDLMSIR